MNSRAQRVPYHSKFIIQNSSFKIISAPTHLVAEMEFQYYSLETIQRFGNESGVTSYARFGRKLIAIY
jgi:glycogen debranching enzyme